MRADCGFDVDVAMLAAGAGAERLIEQGDYIDPSACIACVKQFVESDVCVKCKHCGWRNSNSSDVKSGMCTQRGVKVNDNDVCDMFKHVQEINI